MAPHKLISHEYTFTPVGTAMMMVADVKYARVSTSIPTVNIWWPHTINPNAPIEIIAHTIPVYPKIPVRFAIVFEITWEIIPKAGKIRMYNSGCPKNQNRC